MLKARGPWTRPYLFTAIRHRFIDCCRRELVSDCEPLDEQRAAAHGDERAWPAGHNGPIDRRLIDRALGQLREEERAVLYLAAVEDYTAQQIAQLFDWPRGTVLSRRSGNLAATIC